MFLTSSMVLLLVCSLFSQMSLLFPLLHVSPHSPLRSSFFFFSAKEIVLNGITRGDPTQYNKKREKRTNYTSYEIAFILNVTIYIVELCLGGLPRVEVCHRHHALLILKLPTWITHYEKMLCVWLIFRKYLL